MGRKIWAVINGSGRYLPEGVVSNSDFSSFEFFDENGQRIKHTKGANAGQVKTTQEIIDKFEEITTIRERRYVNDNETNLDIALRTARATLTEDPDCIIVAHNFGAPNTKGVSLDMVPSIANGEKHYQRVENVYTRAFDVIGPRDTLDKVLRIVEPGNSLVLGQGINSLNREEVHRQANRHLEGKDKEKLDSIIVRHDSDDVLCIAEMIRIGLGLPSSVLTYDVVGGCPGALIGAIHSDKLIGSGLVKLILNQGNETLFRVSDPADIDSMLYSDGGGGIQIKAVESETPVGIMSSIFKSHTLQHAFLLRMGRSYDPKQTGEKKYLKMDGHTLYEIALNEVAGTINETHNTAGLGIRDIRENVMHQMNGKMLAGIFTRYMKLYGINSKRFGDEFFFSGDDLREKLNPGVYAALSSEYGVKDSYGYRELSSVFYPVIIDTMGNNSVATDYIVYDKLRRGELKGNRLQKGDIVNFTSVGAGINIVSIDHKEAA